jgi:hypothetical protein
MISAISAKSTTKPPSKTPSGAVTPTATPTAPRPTAPPTPLSARTAVKNWESIGDLEWPSVTSSITARAVAKSIEVFRVPDNRTDVLLFVSGRSVAGPVHFLALGSSGDWIRVAIPLRPNGTVGWVRRSEVLLIENSYRMVIELSSNHLTVFDNNKAIIEASVAAGTGGTPTPTGLFFLKELVPQNPGGALGPYAFGLSGYSDVLTSFAGGEGTIGVHGTNSPGKLGTNVSHGCVRVDNASIVKIAKLLPLGTPVEIVEQQRDAPTIEQRKISSWAFEQVVAVAPVAASPASPIAPAAASPAPAPPIPTTIASAADASAVVTTAAARPPEQVKVLVVNGSGVNRSAARVQAFLVPSRYVLPVPADGAKTTYKDFVYYNEGYEADARELAAKLGLLATPNEPVVGPAAVDMVKPPIPEFNVIVMVGKGLAERFKNQKLT